MTQSPSVSAKKVRPWHLANTTIRTPYRLKGGLAALIEAGFEGQLYKANEESIAWALHEAEIITLSEKTTDVTSISRKWRSVLIKLGLITPEVKTRAFTGNFEQHKIGPEYTVTPNGRRLLQTRSIQAEQEVFLRSLAALYIPSPIEGSYDFPPFSPLRHIIQILLALNEANLEPYISRLEMASIVILTNGTDSIESIVERISRLRDFREKSKSRIRFDGDWIRDQARLFGLNHATLYDYQDVSFRYLKATGLFQSRGRGITLAEEKMKIAKLIANEPEVHLEPLEYVQQLHKGATLPTDTLSGAKEVLGDLIAVASEWDVDFEPAEYKLQDPKDISLARHELEHLISLAKEKQFALEQPEKLDEILAYLDLLDMPTKHSVTFGDEVISIRKEERPAYFEWLLWRVLLALGQLTVPPHEVRRFKVDGDFLPIGTAAGGGADVIGVYEDSALVVEVTLTESSRQEAAEGEPVRRHVANVLEENEITGRAVYGLFVARRIDTNTAETFRIGVWYLAGDRRVDLDIVPLTLTQLRALLKSGIDQNKLSPALLLDAIRELASMRSTTDGAPDWKAQIDQYMNN